MGRDKRKIVVMQRVLRKTRTLLLLATWLVCQATSAFGLDVPKLQGYVNDYAGMISPEVKAGLEEKLKNFEASDSTQVVVLTIPSLEGEDIEGFSIRVADDWKIGQKTKDNGVIFVVSKEDKKMRIEVGRGLEGRLTDLASGRIINLVVTPRFKRGDFDGGFTAGVQAIIDTTRGEFKADDGQGTSGKPDPEAFFTYLIVVMIFILVVSNFSRFCAAAAGALGVPMLVGPFFSAGVPMLIIAGVLGLLAGLFLPVLFSSGRYSGHGGSSWGGGGFFGGGFGGGGSFGGGGGFSGGGGSFGGGGASGGW